MGAPERAQVDAAVQGEQSNDWIIFLFLVGVNSLIPCKIVVEVFCSSHNLLLQAKRRGSVGKRITAIFNAKFHVGSSPGMDVPVYSVHLSFIHT